MASASVRDSGGGVMATDADLLAMKTSGLSYAEIKGDT